MTSGQGAGPAWRGFKGAPRRRLKAVSVLEGTTLASLVFIAVPLMHLAGQPGRVRP